MARGAGAMIERFPAALGDGITHPRFVHTSGGTSAWMLVSS
jgi:hypothetical protein